MNKMKKYFTMWLIPLLLVISIAGCDDRLGITSPPIITIPTVNSTSPANSSVSVAFNSKITATFSEAMDSLTITTATFTLMQGSSFVSGTVSYASTVSTFIPSTNLSPNTAYTATITTGAKDLQGSALAKNYVWSFTTGAAAVVIPPTISSTDPTNSATGVALNQKIAATFSRVMDAATFTSATFTLKQGSTSVSGFVSYSGTTAIFSPASNLAPNTAYTATITSAVQDAAGISLANNYAWSFTTGAAAIVTPPTVILTDPLNAATGVGLNQKIVATFSKTMDASTITSSNFIVMQGTASVSGFVSYSGTTAIFSPASALSPNTKYTVTITTGVKDLSGNALAANYVWSFTSGAAAIVTPPTVSSTDPVNAATGVPLNQKIAATFSKTMDASTITTSNFIVMQGSTSVSGFVSYSGTTATFAPANNLLPNSVYTVTITTGAKDLAGNALANNFVWNFTAGAAAVVTPPTVSSTDPVNAAIGVPFNQKISATFSKTMDASTIQTSNFIVMQGATSVSGFVTYSGTTATFAPASNLSPNTLYTVTITTGAKDLSGNALANNYVWNFTTGAAAVITPPTVISTDPIDAALDVPFNQKVAATFSKTMDASTITTSSFTLKQGTTSVSGFVSYSGTTAIFAPANNLAPSTKYTATISTEAKDLAGTSLVSNYVWTFTTGAAAVIIPPVVLSSDPIPGATGVALDKQISATFSKTMDASTITTSTFFLMQGSTFISGTVVYVGTKATYVPSSNLAPNTTYTATVTTGAKDLAGNALVNNYVWSFTTVIPNYTVTLSSIPAAGGTITKNPDQATYSHGSTLQLTAVPANGYTFTGWSGDATGSSSPLTVTMDGNKNISANFAINTYTLTITSVNGTVTPNPNQPTYNYGSNVILTATPAVGYTFTSWSVDATGSTNPLTVTMNSNKNITARFDVTGPVIDLGAAASFGGFGGNAGMTNQGIFTVVHGDIGTTAASTLITGFHEGLVVYTETPLNIGAVTGTINSAPPAPGTATKFLNAQNALAAANAAYLYLKGLPGGPYAGAGELGGLVLSPGTYTSAGSFKITSGDLTLDAQGNPNAVFVFQMGTTLTVGQAGQPRSIILVGGAQAKNIYWQVGSAATINGAGGGTMAGTIIAMAGVTFSTAGNVALTTLNGRALSLIASVTMVNTIVNIP